MAERELFAERAVKIEPAARRHVLLVNLDGAMLGGEGQALAATGVADDSVVWSECRGGYRQVASGTMVDAAPDGSVRVGGASFHAARGPEKLPSDYLRELQAQGWCCMTGILAPEVVDDLQRVAGTDGYAHLAPDRATPQFSQSAALARTAAEPVSLWVVRQYLNTQDVHFSHTPALIVLDKDDGKRNVQGWHSDYPYHWGIRVPGKVPELPGEVLLGVQRNVCVSEFTKARGATAFKLGSHSRNEGPPQQWGTAGDHAKPGHRAAHGLPYNGPQADVIEAPAGSIILYDSRTWHRAGVNRTDSKRAAMLQAMTPMFVMPKNDTSRAYKHFLQSDAYQQINQRERAELRRLMVHRYLGPAGRDVIAADAELSALFGERAASGSERAGAEKSRGAAY